MCLRRGGVVYYKVVSYRELQGLFFRALYRV